MQVCISTPVNIGLVDEIQTPKQRGKCIRARRRSDLVLSVFCCYGSRYTTALQHRPYRRGGGGGFHLFPGYFFNYFDRKTTPQFAICIVAAHITKQLLSLTAGMTHCSGLASFTLSLWVVSPLSTVFLQLF